MINKVAGKYFSIIILLTCLAYPKLKAQEPAVERIDVNRIAKKINDSLPNGWILFQPAGNSSEFKVRSPKMSVKGNPKSNDEAQFFDQCIISILVVKRVSPDSIAVLRKQNQVLRESICPQSAKGDFSEWYIKNRTIITKIESEPTNYDDKYSYRIECRMMPGQAANIKVCAQVIGFLNRMFIRYKG